MKKYRFIILILLSCGFLLFPFLITHASDLKTSYNEYQKIKVKIKTANTSTENADNPELLTAKKDQLTKIISLFVSTLNNQKDQLLTLQSLNQLQKNQLSEIIQNSINGLIAQGGKIDSSKNDSELKKTSQSILDNWILAQIEYKRSLGQFLNINTINLSADVEAGLINLENQSSNLKSKNKDVTRLEAQISTMRSLLAQIKINNTATGEKISAITKNTDSEAIFQDIIKSIADTNKLITDYHKGLTDTAMEINRLSK